MASGLADGCGTFDRDFVLQFEAHNQILGYNPRWIYSLGEFFFTLNSIIWSDLHELTVT